jgi:cell wall-associated NlpC family hydrolase
VPYSWGGGGPDGPTLGFAQGAGTVGFDCSGLVLFAYAKVGIPLDHYTGSQWDAGRHVPLSQLAPGDLVFFATDVSSPATIHHVGMYVGGGLMIEAPHTGAVVRLASIQRDGLIGAVRIVG